LKNIDNIIFCIIWGLIGLKYLWEIVCLIAIARFVNLAKKDEDTQRNKAGLINFVRHKKAGTKALAFFSGEKILKDGFEILFFIFSPILAIIIYLLFALVLESSPPEILFYVSTFFAVIFGPICYYRAKRKLEQFNWV